MPSAMRANPVEYNSSSSRSSSSEDSVRFEEVPVPAPSRHYAQAAHTAASPARQPSVPSTPHASYAPTRRDSMSAAAKKTTVVHRSTGVPTAMQTHRQGSLSRPTPRPVPVPLSADKNAPQRTSWTTRDTMAGSVASSVARRRALLAQETSMTAAAASEFESVATPAQSSVRRRRDTSQPAVTNGHYSVERRPSSARGPSVSGGAAAVAPFQLLSAGYPVPELPLELEEAITTYYMSQLRRLPVADQERIVNAMVAPRDVKAVMTCLKQQDYAAAAVADSLTASAQATPARSRGHRVASHATPKSAAAASSRRRVLHQPDEHPHAAQQASLSTAQKGAMDRFYRHFNVEACAAFLDDAFEVCVARRTRCYQEQPKIAKDLGVVLPEEQLMPCYVKAVSSLLYNMTGWTQPESQKVSQLVVAIVHEWMPTVVAQTPPPREAPKQAPAAPAMRPPVPMVPRPGAQQSVAAA